MMNEEELKQAMDKLINYCRNTECENCIFAHIEVECGLHNPTAWGEINNE